MDEKDNAKGGLVKASMLVKSSRIAEEFGVTPRTVRNWCEAGLIPAAFRAGKTIRFDLDAVKAAICAPVSRKKSARVEAPQCAVRESSAFPG